MNEEACMSDTRRRKKPNYRLTLEVLEERQLLDAGASGPPLGPLTPFASVADFDSYFLNRALTQYGNLFGTAYSG
jgi:hypothetical protein